MARLKTLMTEILLHDKSDHSAFRSDLQDEIISRYNLLDVFKEVLEQEPSERIKHLAVCIVLCAKATNDWFLGSIQSAIRDKSFSLMKDIFHLCLVPKVSNKEHYIFDKNDFEGVANTSATVMSIFNILLEKFSEETTNDQFRAFLSQISPDMIYLILEHIKDDLWTSELSRFMAKNLLRLMKLFYECVSDEDLLSCNQNLTNKDAFKSVDHSIMNQILKILNPKLTKSNWAKYPSAKSVFAWCLFHTSYPNLYENLEKVLPPTLNFIDDYIMANRISGIQCLQHIMENVSAEELRWYGHADVVYQALKHQLYTNEAELNEASFPAILTILKIVEKIPVVSDSQMDRKTAKHDEVIQIILLNAECENKIILRQIVTSFLGDFVDIMGLSTVKHLQRILKVIESYLEVYEGPEEITRINVLNLLEKVLKNTWPRIPSHMENILRMLLKFLCSLAIQDSSRTETVTMLLTEKVTTCLKLLKVIGGDKCENLIKSVDSPQLPPLCINVLKDVQYSVDCTG